MPTLPIRFPLRSLLPALALLAGTALSPAAVQATVAPEPPRPVDLVIALDVSSSMSGLIASAKQRLWEIVNELGQARPQPDLRVAVLSYGNPGYGAASGYVRIDQPLTRDLDAVNETLFGFHTSGGDEYVARVIARAADSLQWSPAPNALRVVVVAGNESALQDPELPLLEVLRDARTREIVVNAIYCGRDDGGPVARSWQQVAQHAGGFYASIDQNLSAAPVAAAPQDTRLRELNTLLNQTYLPYGNAGPARKENQARQDRNAAAMSPSAAAERAVTKAGKLYRGAEWDLVDAYRAGEPVAELAPQSLPAEMRSMNAAQRSAHLEEQSERRDALRAEITELAKARESFLAQARAATREPGTTGLAGALKKGLRDIAGKKGFEFD